MGATRRLLMDAAENGPRGASRRIWSVLHQNHRTALPAIAGRSSLRSDSRSASAAVERPIPTGSSVSDIRALFADDSPYSNHVRGELPSADRAGVQLEPAKRTAARPGTGSRL